MIRNYLTIAWRSLKRNKVFSFINIFGLAVGLTCCMLITAYLYQELTYDTYAENSKQIYRLGVRTIGNNSANDYPNVDVAVGEGMKKAFPEVLACTRMENFGSAFVKYDDKQFKEEKIAIIDFNFLSFFSIQMLEGDTKTALKDPNSIVITKAFEKKYFGNLEGLGKILSISNHPVKITGVIDKVPENSHFHADAFVSMSTFVTAATPQVWSNVGYYTYILLDKKADPKKLEARFSQLVLKNVVPEIQHDMGVSLVEAQKSVATFLFFLQPITDIHLHSATKYEFEPNGDVHYVYIFGALTIFILLLACINFTNLSTASSSNRSKEIGIRKVLGSEKNSLVSQFLVESVMLTFLALLFALGFVYLLLPYFNNLAGKQITMGFFFNYKVLIVEIIVALIVGIIAGIYPAFVLSSFRIISVLKGNGTTKISGSRGLRSGLIVFQFTISTALIIATFVVYQQLHFMQDKKLGYDKDQILVINDANTLGNNVVAFKQQLLTDTRVLNATISNNIPGSSSMGGTQVYAKEISDQGTRSEIGINIYWIDHSYIPTLGMQLVKGRNFYVSTPVDSASVIVNEAAVRELGFGSADPIGKTIIRSGQRHYIIVGVVKDFNYTSAKQKIGPLMMLASNNSRNSIIVKMKSGDVQGFLNDVKQQWINYHASTPFSYSFLDQQFAKLYNTEIRTGSIFTSFSIIAVIIACLGLFGLAAFMIKQRVREIGIRKVLGASTCSITTMLSIEFLKLILIAAFISFPLTWYAMTKWLQDFAYRTTIHWWVFLLAGLIALIVAGVTISFQAIKAAIANPVKSLRNE
jgi:putative ABC transport system permease protein